MRIKFLLPLLLLFTLTGFSQNKDEKREQIKALKVSFLTSELNLTAEESEKFWPIYNAFEEKQYQIRCNRMKPVIKKLHQSDDKISEKEAAGYLSQLEDADEELFMLHKKLVADLKPVIGSLKVLKLKKAEEDFKSKLLQKYKDNKK